MFRHVEGSSSQLCPQLLHRALTPTIRPSRSSRSCRLLAQPVTAQNLSNDDIDWAQLLAIDVSCRAGPPLECHDNKDSIVARQQQELSAAERKRRRAEARQLGKKLVTVHLGKNGITPSFLRGLSDALHKNEYLKVKLAGSCMLDADEAQQEICRAIDCVTLHSIGFTFIVYRNKLLPRPAWLLSQPAHGASAGAADAGSKSEVPDGPARVSSQRPNEPPQFAVIC